MNTGVTGHTLKRFDAELQKLEHRVLTMGNLVKEQMQKVQRGVLESGIEDTDELVEGDRPINRLELKADKLIIKLIARRAPVGSDLRYIVAVSRIVNDMENLGDETIDMARTLRSSKQDLGSCMGRSAIQEIAALLDLTVQVFDKVLYAFEEHDRVVATEIAFGHAGPDGELQSRLRKLTECALRQEAKVDEVVNLVLAARSLERMGGYIRNIGEHVIYLVTGEDVRHQE